MNIFWIKILPLILLWIYIILSYLYEKYSDDNFINKILIAERNRKSILIFAGIFTLSIILLTFIDFLPEKTSDFNSNQIQNRENIDNFFYKNKLENIFNIYNLLKTGFILNLFSIGFYILILKLKYNKKAESFSYNYSDIIISIGICYFLASYVDYIDKHYILRGETFFYIKMFPAGFIIGTAASLMGIHFKKIPEFIIKILRR